MNLNALNLVNNFSSLLLIVHLVTFKNFLLFFFVPLYKKLLELTGETFSACLIALDNFYEVYGCFVITDFILTMLAFLKVLVAE